jgi:hypothetical protein
MTLPSVGSGKGLAVKQGRQGRVLGVLLYIYTLNTYTDSPSGPGQPSGVVETLKAG